MGSRVDSSGNAVFTADTSTVAKDYVRGELDRSIIEAFRREHYPDQPLAYLGLPGPDLLDVRAWREFIGRWTAVQSADTPELRQSAEMLELNALRERLERGFHLVLGNIDEYLARDDLRPALQFPYEVVNLDYVGGLVNARDHGTGSLRLDAIRALFTHQNRHAFVLLLTVNLRDRDEGELEDHAARLEDEMRSLDAFRNVAEVFESHREQGNAGLLKLYVPCVLDGFALATGYELRFAPPVLYSGSRQMMHFVVECLPHTEQIGTRLPRFEDRLAIVNASLLIRDSNRTSLAQHDFGQLIRTGAEAG